MAPSRRLSVVFVAWGTVEIVLFAGLVFGWASLVFVLKQEGYFAENCGQKSPTYENTTSVDHDDVDIAGVTTHPARFDRYGYVHNNSATGVESHLRGVYSDGNPALFATCSEQDKHLNLVYTLAVVITGVSTFANGWLLDRHGTWACRIVGLSTYTLGILMVAFSSPGASMILYPSLALLSYGGYIIILTNLQLGNLIPDKRATIISLHCGAFDSSSFVLLLVKVAYEAGISVKVSFLTLSCLFSLVFVSTFWYMPKRYIPHPLPENYTLDLGCRPSCKPTNDQKDQPVSHEGHHKVSEADVKVTKDSAALTEQKETLLEGHSEKGEQEAEESFVSSLSSPLFVWDVVWLSCHRFASWSFIGRLNPLLATLAHGNKALVSQYTSVYAMLQFFGIFLAPLSGRLMDRHRTPQKDVPPNPRLDKLEMAITSFIIDTSLGSLLAIVVTIPVLEVQYASFGLHVLHRALLYGPNAAFLATAFPMKHFGKLFGLAMSLSAAFGLLQYPIFILIQGPLDNNPLLANIFTLLLMILSFAHPLHIWMQCRRQRLNDRRVAASTPIYKPKKPYAIELSNRDSPDTPLQEADA